MRKNHDKKAQGDGVPLAEETEQYLIRKLEELQGGPKERGAKKRGNNKGKTSVTRKGQAHQ